MLTKQELFDRIARMTVSRRDGRPALYKPLLLLLVLGRVDSGGPRRIAFVAIEAQLRVLLERYSPGDSPDSVGQPWWHLPTDGLWRVLDDRGNVLRESGTPRKHRVPSLVDLRRLEGEFPDEVAVLLAAEPGAAIDAMQLLLARFFNDAGPEGRSSILRDVGAGRDHETLPARRSESRVGRPYSNTGRLPASAVRDPFEVDPDVVDRGNQAHANTLDALADFLRDRGFHPLRPNVGDPMFDLAWECDGVLFVAEVKSATDANEEKQLRLGLGQVLRYRQGLEARELNTVAVLVSERKPVEPGWMEICNSLGVRLVWPGEFESLLAASPM